MNIDINNIDFNNIAGWSISVIFSAVVVTFLLVLGTGYYYFTSKHLGGLEKVIKKEDELKAKYALKHKKANNLQAYKKLMKNMESSLDSMIKELPKKAEVADLLVEVSQVGLSNGLKFNLFQPETEILKGFYVEMPISIVVTGNYHQFASFVSDISLLPRIVTIHDFSMTPKENEKVDELQMLTIALTAKTYRYLDNVSEE